ncbi:MAG: DUF932 domain-containing protein [bacterium]
MEATRQNTIIAPGSDVDASFLSWQDTLSGEIFPIYTITAAGHPLCNSMVREETLRKLRLRVPRTPSPYPETPPSPWQRLGVELNHPQTAQEALTFAGLDFTVVKKPIREILLAPVEGCVTMRTDTDQFLGIVDGDYEPIQNIDAFRFFDALVAEGEATYETAGVFGNGERVWLLAKLPGYIRVQGNDIVNKYILLTNSHDGRSQVHAKLTPVRVVCNNTLTSALDGEGELHIRGGRNAAKDLGQAVTILGSSISLCERLETVFNHMASTKITESQLRKYVQTLVPDGEEGENTSRTREIRESVLQLYESGLGANLSRGTVWGAFNSVTEYTDHMMMDVNPTARLSSIWFGRGEQLKLKAFRLAEQMLQA